MKTLPYLIMLVFLSGCISKPEIVEQKIEPKRVAPKMREHEPVSDLEARLFQLSDNELFDIGITAIEGNYWSVAWSDDSDAHIDAITDALATVGLSAQGSFSDWVLADGMSIEQTSLRLLTR